MTDQQRFSTVNNGSNDEQLKYFKEYRKYSV